MKILMFVFPLAVAQNTIYFPPESSSRNQIPNFTVHAGDSINITWSLAYPSVDLRIQAWAPNSNFTETPYYNPGLNSDSYFTYVLEPWDYLINDTSIGISAFFLLNDNLDHSQSVRTQNFTIFQPRSQSYGANGQLTIPADASTWTGSVTLYSSVGFKTAASVVTSSTMETITDSMTSASSTVSLTATAVIKPSALSALSITSTSSATVSTVTISATAQAATSSPSSSERTSGAKTGLGVGLGVGLGSLGGLAIFACLIARRRRRERSPATGTEHDLFKSRRGIHEIGMGRQQITELDGANQRPNELDADRQQINELALEK